MQERDRTDGTEPPAGSRRRRRAFWLGGALALMLGVGFAAVGRTQDSWPLWEVYAHQMVDGQGRVIDRSAGDVTTSEGQAYGMFFALVANDRDRFDKILSWTATNLAQGDLGGHLPAWRWGRTPEGEWKVLDANPASDADLWMSYTLMEAGRLWHEERYTKVGASLAGQMTAREVFPVPGLGKTLVPGPAGFRQGEQIWVLNPSYLPPQVLARMAKTMPGGPWGEVLQSLEPMLAHGSGGGFAMDWVEAGMEGISPAVPPRVEGPRKEEADAVAVGSYDAIRVYLWLGIADPRTAGVKEGLSRVMGMAGYMKDHAIPPERVDGMGKVISPDGPPGFSAAIAPYLMALGMSGEGRRQMDRLAASKDGTTGLYGKNAVYYDQNLALFAAGWSEGRYHFDRDGSLGVRWR